MWYAVDTKTNQEQEGKIMRTLGNILWFLFGGLIGGLAWTLAGCIWCITIIGIPFGLQCFKFASLAFFPFGKDVVYGGGGVSFLANIIWLIFFGWEMAVGYLGAGCGRVHDNCWHSGGTAVL